MMRGTFLCCFPNARRAKFGMIGVGSFDIAKRERIRPISRIGRIGRVRHFGQVRRSRMGSYRVRHFGRGRTESDGSDGDIFLEAYPYRKIGKREAADRNPQPQLQAVKKRELFTCRDVRSGELRCTGRILRPDRNTGWGRDKRTRCCGPTGRVLRRSAGRVCRQDERALSE